MSYAEFWNFTKEIQKNCETRVGLMINNFHSNENVPDLRARKRTKEKTIPKVMKKLALNSTSSPVPHKRLDMKGRQKLHKAHERDRGNMAKKRIFSFSFHFWFFNLFNERIGKREIQPRGKFVLIYFSYHLPASSQPATVGWYTRKTHIIWLGNYFFMFNITSWCVHQYQIEWCLQKCTTMHMQEHHLSD